MSAMARALPSWTHDYATLRDRIASFPNQHEIRSVNQDGEDVEILRYWPDASWTVPKDAQRLILLGPPNDSTAAELAKAGWQQSTTMHLLAGKPDDVEQVVKLADTSGLFEAPMDNYDVVEVTDFDRPVARGRMRYGENYGLLTDPDLFSPADPDTARRAVLANFAGAAFGHGLPWLLLVATAEHAQQLPEGWSKATTLSFWQHD
ncbi:MULTISPECIES: hypothetical protein [Glutamicibacter]|jgi:hypothetical protein|uniref:hypothetical protein n=1 Tax=Glutamicibacter TaxID=1742989 RepID=UPI0011F326EB|nr:MULTISPECIES: hypothetical protein [Glutamicibacter]MBM7767209.1 hypothetical protein [Glutamicibacter nicotianae]QEP06070.1 hypothetical protein F0M17_01745 [Glutamicibacter sp. ZJUTW]UTM48498.1 hypothetical protein XH9_06835 [Glutamicibacter mysorens]WIV44389.1 hypothetical protein QQS42_01860 [Glutamicibacter nicotianae]